ncbi:MAG: VWA domain-containing protein, partial [Pararhodobacter sp.]|nr:VWA domain-containing protein [Pararhodobacter sp.]
MRFTRYVAPLAVALSALSAPALASDTAAIMVFDASGSMWNRIEGDITRIEVARDVMEEFFSNRDAATPISVIAYGHTRRGDCGDIEVIAPLGLHDAADLTQRIRRLNPQGMTPLTDSLILARQQIPPTAESADIILVTDGLETCGGDPCAAAADIAAEGISIRAHVVAFGMTEEQTNTLACIPEQTGGMLFNTNSGAELAEAMTAVETREPVEPEPEPEAMVEPEPEVIEAATAIMGPDSVRMGERFTINWSETIDERDFVAIVPMGADEGALGTSARVRTGSSAELRAPAAPGLYELRYVQNDGRATLASAPIEVTIAETSISGPDSVRMGERFTINWSDNIDSRDFVAIVPAGADEGTLGTSNRVRSSSSTELRAPSEPGMYELRYVLDEGRVTLASAAIEVTGATASISGPDSVRMGERFTINWSDNIDSRDFVAIVP